MVKSVRSRDVCPRTTRSKHNEKLKTNDNQNLPSDGRSKVGVKKLHFKGGFNNKNRDSLLISPGNSSTSSYPGIPSQTKDLEQENYDSSSDEFVSLKSFGTKAKSDNLCKLPRSSALKQRSKFKSTDTKDECLESTICSRSDSDDNVSWEDVTENPVGELDYMKDLITGDGEIQCHDEKENSSYTIEVPLTSLKKNSKLDPAKLENLAAKRRLKKYFYLMHLTDVICFVVHSRFLNKLCDNPLYQAIGLSLLNKVKTVMDKKNNILNKVNWAEEHLRACIISILSREGTQLMNKFEPSNDPSYVTSKKDCIILFVAALRSLGFDVRLLVGLSPLPLKPTASTIQRPNEIRKPKTPNRKVISSDEEPESEYPSSSSTLKAHIFTFAEVFLPSKEQWVCIDPTSQTHCVNHFSCPIPLLYVLAVTTTNSADPYLAHYVDRNPIDVTPRYDKNWCLVSRSNRIPQEKWNYLLGMQRSFFNLDACQNNALVSRGESLPTLKRDKLDEELIRQNLLLEPIPKRMQDFKNHPVYVLRRHLLKFQIIHPPDAVALGFFQNEPVYSRDCVHLCHTRESWLKEAMVVRAHEKPAKIVKARFSIKRKLLQGGGDKADTVEIFGPWQVEPYEPPRAENGIVPRSIHGTVELFKPCMLPHGCAHICLSGIQHIAKKLGIDCAQAVVGWTFHGAGWAHPKVHGYVVCKESVPILFDSWRAERMNAAKAAALDRSERNVERWRKLVYRLLLWHSVKAKFALAPLQASQATVSLSQQSKRHDKSIMSKKTDTVKSTPVLKEQKSKTKCENDLTPA